MYAPTRDQARQFLFETWRKYQAGEALSALERIAVEIELMHPEYHALLAAPERNAERDYLPESGSVNPFLHLSLHLAVEEQLAIDRPTGICTEYARLVTLSTTPHAAKHVILECLGETIWQAQRDGTAPDEARYLECLRRSHGR
jgi:hypothetical protein